MCCGGALGAEARTSWGSGALRCASHGDGEVAAARMAGVAWRREGSSSAREGGWRGVWARRVGDHGKQEVAGALHGGGRRRSAPAALKQNGREVRYKTWTFLQFQKIPGTLL